MRDYKLFIDKSALTVQVRVHGRTQCSNSETFVGPTVLSSRPKKSTTFLLRYVVLQSLEPGSMPCQVDMIPSRPPNHEIQVLNCGQSSSKVFRLHHTSENCSAAEIQDVGNTGPVHAADCLTCLSLAGHAVL